MVRVDEFGVQVDSNNQLADELYLLLQVELPAYYCPMAFLRDCTFSNLNGRVTPQEHTFLGKSLLWYSTGAAFFP